MIRRCDARDLPSIGQVINDGAAVYRGVIPADRWAEPYMPDDKLRHEIAAGVEFWGFEADGQLVGVMGMQQVNDVTLIRHAYVRRAYQGQGIGTQLLDHLRGLQARPILIGTWADAVWAITFYQRHGFTMVGPQQKDRLLRTYWTVPDRQIETSVVLADQSWFSAHSVI